MKNRRPLAEARDEVIRTQGETCPIHDAEQQIIAEFAGGRRHAEGIPLPAGIEYEPISEALWQQAREPAPSTGLEPPWMRGRAVITVDFDAGTAMAQGGRGFTYIREVLDPAVPDDGPSPPQAPLPTQQKPKNPGGAPARYDWDRIWIEIVSIAHVSADGLPERRALLKRLRDAMTAWGWDDQPSDSAMKAKLHLLYRNLPNPPD
jgi:hypothetical protein